MFELMDDYQENAVNRALDAVAEGKKRILLTLATGTGKTYISSQFSYKLFESKWNLQGDQNRRPRILFLADRNILASQALNDFNVFADDAKIRISPKELSKRNFEVPKNGNIFFYVDSEPDYSTLYSPPGDIYTKATDDLVSAFTHGYPFVEGPVKGNQGERVSAIAPVRDSAAGKIITVLGVDVDASDWRVAVSEIHGCFCQYGQSYSRDRGRGA